MAEQGSKSGRRERHARATHAYKERKALRQRRALIHRVMARAEEIRKSRKRGKTDRDKIMRELGYERIAEDGRKLPVEQKYKEVE